MKRRDLLSMTTLGAGLMLAACAGEKLPALPVEVKLPDELTQLMKDAHGAISGLGSLKEQLSSSALSLIERGKSLVASITSSTTLEQAKPAAAALVDVLKMVLPHLPSTGTVGAIATAVETILPEIAKVAGLVAMFARRRPTGMTVAQARALLHAS